MLWYLFSFILVAAAILTIYFSSRIFASVFLNPHKHINLAKTPEQTKAMAQYYVEGINDFMQLQPEELEIKSDGFKLHGYYLASAKPVTIILLHGWRDEAQAMMKDALTYYRSGYTVFLPDLRSHGKSQGKYIGMGCVDRKDILGWIRFLMKKDPGKNVFVLDGLSMGAATALALSGDADFPAEVKAIISDSAYPSVQELLPGMLKFKKGYIKVMHLWLLERWCQLLCHYSFTQDTPFEQVAKSKTPTLLIHGSADNFVPMALAQKLYDNCSAPKEFWAVDAAGHGNASWIAREQYGKRKLDFLERVLAEHPQD
ncbi:MAG: alpha/beta hydrolase [Negativicutes bacterium]|nr:alpha/beta hydrolase [Negativicutes bacterium]